MPEGFTDSRDQILPMGRGTFRPFPKSLPPNPLVLPITVERARAYLEPRAFAGEDDDL